MSFADVGWPAYVRLVERHAAGTDLIVADNYGEAGALELFAHALPPVASADVTMRYWRPRIAGRQALLVGYTRGNDARPTSPRPPNIRARDPGERR